jgi:hypothetical protein
MKKMLLASVAVISLGLSMSAYAQDTTTSTESADPNAAAAAGGAAGAATGGTIGFLIGGPVGAIIGGFSGAVIGADAAVSSTSVEYAGNNPVESVEVDGELAPGAAVPSGVTVYPIEGDDAHGYFYANGRVWIVDLATNTLVFSPGYAIDQAAVDYAKEHPVTPIETEDEVVVGYIFENGAAIVQIPDEPFFGYVYVNDKPVLVDTATGMAVWIG